MSRITDSRDPRGSLGFPILQHHRYNSHGWSLDMRGSVIGVRVEDRDDNQGGLGSWMRPKGEENVGDVTQWLLWPKASRPISGFSEAWPAILDDGSGAVATGGGNPPPPPPPSSSSPNKKTVKKVQSSGQVSMGVPGSGMNAYFPPGQKDANAIKGKTKKGQIKVGGKTVQAGNLKLTFPESLPDANSPKYKGKNGLKKWQADIAKANKAGGSIPPPPAPPPAGVMDDSAMLPVIDDEMSPDSRFSTLEPRWPEINGKRLWPKFPKGWYGTALPGTNENVQVEYFMPSDPRLIAVHKYGDVEMGSLVCEMKQGFRIDEDHSARLQSMMKVLRAPAGLNIGISGAGAGNVVVSENVIAWNIGFSGLGDTQGGFVWERVLGMNPGGGTGSTVTQGGSTIGIGIAAVASQSWSGPFDVGLEKDQHNLGTDSDGNIINSLHLSANSYFRRGAEDGPLNLSIFLLGDDFQKRAKVYCGFNPNTGHEFVGGPRAGKWDWWTTVPQYVPTRVPPPEDPTPTGDNPPNIPDVPNRPTDVPDSPTIAPGTVDWSLFETPGIDGKIPTLKALDVPQTPQAYLCCLSDQAMPSILGRPQMIVGGIPDLRKTTKGVSDEVTDEHDRKAPIVARIEAFGQQAANEWIYTQQPTASRFVAGTADGGFIVMPPEVDMADDLNGWAIPACRTTSNTYFAVLRGTYFGSGLPDLTNGGLKTAHRWSENSSGDLTFERVNSSGTAANALRLTSDQLAQVPLGTSTYWGNSVAKVGVNLTSVGTDAAITEKTLATTTVRANTLDAVGKGLRIKVWGTVAGNTNAKTIRLKWGGVTLVSNDVTPNPDGVAWDFEATLFATAIGGHGGSQDIIAEGTVGSVVQTKSFTFPAVDTEADVDVTVTGQNGVASANDIVFEGLLVEAIT